MSKQFEISIRVDHEFLYLTLHIGENVHTSTIALEDLEKTAGQLLNWIRNKKQIE